MSTETTHIEHDLEQTRARLDATIGALQDKLSPGQLVDQALDYFKSSGGVEFGRNLKDNVQANPMPIALVGIGLAWLMMSGSRRPEPHGYEYERGDLGVSHEYSSGAEQRRALEKANEAAAAVRRTASESYEAFQERVYSAKASALGVSRSAGETMSAFASRVDNAMNRAAEASRAAANSVREGVSSAVGSMRHGVSAASSGIGSAAGSVRQGVGHAGEGIGSAARSAHDAGSRTLGFIQDQPLLLGALGISVGALLAAMLPSTRTEDQLMGGLRDDLLDRAQEAGGAVLRSGSRVAEEAIGAAMDRAEREGLTASDAKSATESARSTVTDAAQRMRHVVEDAANAGRQAAAREFGGADSIAGSRSADQMPNAPKSDAARTELERNLGLGATATPLGESATSAATERPVAPSVGMTPRPVSDYGDHRAG